MTRIRPITISFMARTAGLERTEVATILHEHDVPTWPLMNSYVISSEDYEVIRPLLEAVARNKRSRLKRFAEAV